MCCSTIKPRIQIDQFHGPFASLSLLNQPYEWMVFHSFQHSPQNKTEFHPALGRDVTTQPKYPPMRELWVAEHAGIDGIKVQVQLLCNSGTVMPELKESLIDLIVCLALLLYFLKFFQVF